MAAPLRLALDARLPTLAEEAVADVKWLAFDRGLTA
jgi:hypothetical protein